MQILIISAVFYPQKSPRSFRTTELVKELVRKKHNVTLITVTTTANIDAFTKQCPCNIIKMDVRANQLFDASRGMLFMKKIKQLLNRGVQWLFDYPDSTLMFKVLRKLQGLQGFDLMISVAAPHAIHWGVALASKKNKISNIWVADCGDPYMGLELEKIKKPFYFSWLEKWVFRRTDYITVPFEGAKKAYFSEFQSKIRVISQGFNLTNNNLLTTYQKNDTPTFAYAGGLSSKGVRCPFKLMELLNEIKTDFFFYIFSPDILLLAHYKKKLGNKLVLTESIERGKLLIELSKMDFLINFDNGITTQLPSKLIDYSIANRPVLNMNATNPNLEKIKKFINGNYNTAMQLPAAESFDIKRVTENFIRLSN